MKHVQEQSKTILITGITGFIGRHLTATLLGKGFQVYGLTRNIKKAESIFNGKVHLIERIDEISTLPIDAVINLAGEPLGNSRWNSESKKLFRDSRLSTTNNLFNVFKTSDRKLPLLINASAIGIYGNRSEEVLQETASLGDDFAAHLCRDWEFAADQFFSFGTRVCKLRIGIVLGSDGGALSKMLPPFRLGLGGRLGDGKQWMSWIHLKDLIGLMVFCIENENASGVINAVAPNPVTNKIFTSSLANALHRPSIFPVPSFVLRVLMGEVADALLLSSQRVEPRVASELGYKYQFPEINSAFSDLFKK